jgi:hypothetical protein
MRRSFLFVILLSIASCRDEKPEFPKFARLVGTWNVNLTRKLTPISGGNVLDVEDVFSIKFNNDQTGTMYRSLISDFIWVTECDPDIIFISIKQDGFPTPVFINEIYEIRKYDNCCNLEFYQTSVDTINSIAYNAHSVWELTR